MADPYVYPGSTVLKNKLDIRDVEQLAAIERAITTAKFLSPPPALDVTADGYRSLHRYIFEDVYDWAGDYRSVNIAKGNSFFCAPQFIAKQMNERFDVIRADDRILSRDSGTFAESLAEHVSELNAIHPFREGNGRTLQIWLQQMADAAGVPFELTRVPPQGWINASITSFAVGDTKPFETIILRAIGKG
ncbi:MAG: Fic family protein [Hyphomicrobiaceae bacterium]|nr:Fic family protein [Hyphomicrobiaceae bacterium]MCC0009626.1 Fic family protein [Hyphomicrobiaceae bacterium]